MCARQLVKRYSLGLTWVLCGGAVLLGLSTVDPNARAFMSPPLWVVLSGLCGSVILHEYIHAGVARYYGVAVENIEIKLFGLRGGYVEFARDANLTRRVDILISLAPALTITAGLSSILLVSDSPLVTACAAELVFCHWLCCVDDGILAQRQAFAALRERLA